MVETLLQNPEHTDSVLLMHAVLKNWKDGTAGPFDGKSERLITKKGEEAGFVARMPRINEVARAAKRCEEALGKIQNRSKSIVEVKERAWAACFGEDLHTALLYPDEIRKLNVLILGDTGTGKELVARAIQAGTITASSTFRASDRLSVNIASLSENLIHSELFGHVKGAFTGANADSAGLIQRAHGSTLFMDEIGDMPQRGQVLLLRVIQERKVTPVGAKKEADAHVRYISATHKSIDNMVERGTFRRDLFYRLNGITIRIPPLRERPDDIRPIAEALLESGGFGKNRTYRREEILEWTCSPDAMEREWPGNVRELEIEIRQRLLGISHLARPKTKRVASPHSDQLNHEARIVLEERIISKLRATDNDENNQINQKDLLSLYTDFLLARFEGNLSKTARALGVNISTLHRRRRK